MRRKRSVPSVAPSPLQIHVPKRATFKTQPSTLSNYQKPPTAMPQSMSTDAITLNDWYLNGKDLAALLRYNKCELTTLCEQRGLDIDGTKQEMAEALMHWRKHALPPGGESMLAEHGSKSLPDLAGLALEDETEQGEKKEDEGEGEEVCRSLFAAPVGSASCDSGLGSAEPIDGEILLEDLKIGRKCGSGGYKTVYKGVYRGDTQVAIGIIETAKLGKEDIDDLENEMQVLQQCRHDNIVRFIGTCKVHDGETHANGLDFSQYYIITEFCQHGDLSDYMISRQRPPFQRQLALMYDIAFGCAYLHARRPAIIHRDLKSLNILIDANGRAKIGDFGLAKIKKRAKVLMHTVVGTPNWQAPEMWLDDPKYSEKVDVYSCGLIFWEILQWSNKYPFNDLSECQIYEKVGKKELRPPLRQDPQMKRYPRPMISLIERMWSQDPNERPTMMEIVSELSSMMR